MNNLIRENIYGHLKRLHWIISHINKQDTIVEFGCGTGYMITRPLAKNGYNIIGVDTDRESISLGKEIFIKEGLDPDILKAKDIAELDLTPDVVIASEVLEHIPDEELDKTLYFIRSKLKQGGRLLVTVPNGYGWFEMESFFWFKVGFGRIIKWLKLDHIIIKIKESIFAYDFEDLIPSTLADSPHIQRFTYNEIQKILHKNSYEVIDIKGSVLFAGPFSNLLFTGIESVMRLNGKLGQWFPRMAAGFFISASKRD
jgi:2-polyprenyl-3-methyl-5-hydroxy-6-metoxy-1,4-benzoquinol methylase